MIKPVSILILILVSIMVAGCAKKEGLAAKVDGENITISEVNEMIDRYVLVNRKIDSLFETPRGLLLENKRKQFLDGLIDKKIMLKKAKALGITVTDSELVGKVAALRNANVLSDDSLFAEYLREMKISSDQFRTNVKEIMVLEKTADQYFSGLDVSQDEALAYYNDNGSKYSTEFMKASHILFRLPLVDMPEKGMLTITTRLSRSRPELKGDALARAAEAESLKILGKAESVLAELKKGAQFDALAKKYSEDPSAAYGGELGSIGKGEMVAAFDSAAFLLKEGEISSLVRTPFGVHIIKALVSPKKKVRPFDDVKKSIVDELMQEKKRKKIKELRDSSKIEVLWDCKEETK
jgi:foldase protein PrsA